MIIGGAGFWLGALQIQVLANDDKIEEQSETKERLVRIEERSDATKDDIGEIKAEQTAQGKEQVAQGKILAKILEVVKGDE